MSHEQELIREQSKCQETGSGMGEGSRGRAEPERESERDLQTTRQQYEVVLNRHHEFNEHSAQFQQAYRDHLIEVEATRLQLCYARTQITSGGVDNTAWLAEIEHLQQIQDEQNTDCRAPESALLDLTEEFNQLQAPENDVMAFAERVGRGIRSEELARAMIGLDN